MKKTITTLSLALAITSCRTLVTNPTSQPIPVVVQNPTPAANHNPLPGSISSPLSIVQPIEVIMKNQPDNKACQKTIPFSFEMTKSISEMSVAGPAFITGYWHQVTVVGLRENNNPITLDEPGKYCMIAIPQGTTVTLSAATGAGAIVWGYRLE